jgi:hypothetical protein
MIHALLAAVVAATGWSAPQVLSNGAIALGPELSVAPSGAAIAVWDHESGPDCAQAPASLTCAHIVEFSERPSALGWSPPLEIARPGIGARPQVTLNDSGRAAVIWVHDIGRDRVVQGTYRTGANQAFPNPNDLSAAVLEVRDHHVGLDAAGNVAVVWAERHESDFDVAGDIRDAASGTWLAPLVLSSAAVRAGPRLAVSASGAAYAVWVEGHVVKAVVASLHSGEWEQPLVLAGNAGADVGVAANAGGDAVAAWTLQDRPGIEIARKPRDGSWGVPVPVSSSSGGPAAALGLGISADGTAVAAWTDAAGTLQSAVGTRVSTVAAGAAEPQVAVDPRGDAVLVWRGRGGLLASVRPPAAGAWQPAEELSSAEISAPRIALDGSGDGFAAWNLRNGDALPVMISGFGAGAWTPTLTNTRRPAIRGVPRAGRRVACDAGAWAGTVPITYAYRWLRNGQTRATGRTYFIRRADAGTRLACRVAATNAARTLLSMSMPVRVRP